MYLVFNVFYFYSGVGQKDSGVGRAHLAPPFATPLVTGPCTAIMTAKQFLGSLLARSTSGMHTFTVSPFIHSFPESVCHRLLNLPMGTGDYE
jgi:hypothetical protein